MVNTTRPQPKKQQVVDAAPTNTLTIKESTGVKTASMNRTSTNHQQPKREQVGTVSTTAVSKASTRSKPTLTDGTTSRLQAKKKSDSKPVPAAGRTAKPNRCFKRTVTIADDTVRTLEEAEEFYLKHKELIDEVIELAGDIPYVGQYVRAVEIFLEFAAKYGKDLIYLEKLLDGLAQGKLVVTREKAIRLTKDIALKDVKMTIQKMGKPSISGYGTLVAKLDNSHTLAAKVHISKDDSESKVWRIGGRVISDLTLPILPQKKSLSLKNSNINLEVNTQTMEWMCTVTENIALGKSESNSMSLVFGNKVNSFQSAMVDITVDTMCNDANNSTITANDLVTSVVETSSFKSTPWFIKMKKTLDSVVRLVSASIYAQPFSSGDVILEMDVVTNTKGDISKLYFLQIRADNDNQSGRREVALVLGPDFSRYIASTNAVVQMTWGPLNGATLKFRSGDFLNAASV